MRKSIVWVVICIIFASSLFACSDSTPSTPVAIYSISGTVTSSATGLQGVTMTLSSSATTTTDSSGNYSFVNLANGSYTITPSKTSYTFSPPSSTLTLSGTNIGSVNFVSTTPLSGAFFSNKTLTIAESPYLIAGDVQIPSGVTLTIEPGVTIMYSDAYEILIKGNIVSNGTTSQPIVFTSATAISSGATQVHFSGANLSNSQISYVNMSLAGNAIRIDTDNTGILSVSNSILNANITNYNGNSVVTITDSTITAPIVGGPYSLCCLSSSGPLSQCQIDIQLCELERQRTGYVPDGTSCTAGSANIIGSVIINTSLDCGNGLISNSSATNSTLSTSGTISGTPITNSNVMNAKIHNSTVSSSSICGLSELSYAQLTNTSISASSASISDSVISFDNSYTATQPVSLAGSINYSKILGNVNGTGLVITGGTSISDSEISGNATGIKITSGATTIANSNFTNNSGYNIENQSSSAITATNNYWGTTDTTAISTKIFDYYDNINYGIVTFSPYLSTPATTGPR